MYHSRTCAGGEGKEIAMTEKNRKGPKLPRVGLGAAQHRSVLEGGQRLSFTEAEVFTGYSYLLCQGAPSVHCYSLSYFAP